MGGRVHSVVPLAPDGLRSFAQFPSYLAKLSCDLWQLLRAKEEQRHEKYHHKFGKTDIHRKVLADMLNSKKGSTDSKYGQIAQSGQCFARKTARCW